MIDLSFIRTVETAIAGALANTFSGPGLDEAARAATVRRISKEAAQRLFFDLDGKALLDLGMIKLAAEQQASPPRRTGVVATPS
jgi:hypothetical protein